ncbi:MAG: hypothetical protein ACI90V_012591, partial [Bacillariaceae sp.]
AVCQIRLLLLLLLLLLWTYDDSDRIDTFWRAKAKESHITIFTTGKRT